MVCFCNTPTNFTSEIDGYVWFGCPEHNIEFDNELRSVTIEETIKENKMMEAAN